jgi:hypothetical protein
MAASSRVFSSISRGGTQWVYSGRLFVVSARTNKMHDHHDPAARCDRGGPLRPPRLSRESSHPRYGELKRRPLVREMFVVFFIGAFSPVVFQYNFVDLNMYVQASTPSSH